MQAHLWQAECVSVSHAKADPESTLPPGVTCAPVHAHEVLTAHALSSTITNIHLHFHAAAISCIPGEDLMINITLDKEYNVNRAQAATHELSAGPHA